jgi:hypothetical protein
MTDELEAMVLGQQRRVSYAVLTEVYQIRKRTYLL